MDFGDIFSNYDGSDGEAVINNTYDYSNIIPTLDNVIPVIRFFSDVYNYFTSLVEEDMKKNERLKYEYKNYNYKNYFKEDFDIHVKREGYEIASFKKYDLFMEELKNGKIGNVTSLDIRMNLGFQRGKEGSLEHHENYFRVSFKPYNVVFTRKSNFNDNEMDQIEKNINNLMKKFNVCNTIFCSK